MKKILTTIFIVSAFATPNCFCTQTIGEKLPDILKKIMTMSEEKGITGEKDTNETNEFAFHLLMRALLDPTGSGGAKAPIFAGYEHQRVMEAMKYLRLIKELIPQKIERATSKEKTILAAAYDILRSLHGDNRDEIAAIVSELTINLLEACNEIENEWRSLAKKDLIPWNIFLKEAGNPHN
ncbi:hypothetical protein HOD08_00655 [bacterium]|jgi:hypothetical protein|nr:hypothetical protein [bacterium]